MKELLQLELERRRRARCLRYRNDPVGYGKDCYGYTLWEWEVPGKGLIGQAPIARKVAENAQLPLAKWVSVRSGHKVGKSDLMSLLALWWYDTREEGRVVLTSSSFGQIENINWPSIAKLWRMSKWLKQGTIGETARSGIDYNTGQKYIVGVSTDRTENLGGYSGKELLWLIDESSGINEAIFEAVEGNTAGNAMGVMCGNMTKASGTFHDSHNELAGEYSTFHLSSWDTPNAQTGEVIIPGLAVRGWCEKCLARWGENDPRYKVRVMGEAPNVGVNTIFPADVVANMLIDPNDSRLDPRVNRQQGRLSIGVDVARMGDDVSVVQAVRGKVAYPPRIMLHADTMDLVQLVRETVEQYAVQGEVPIVNVDTVFVGIALFDYLNGVDWVQATSLNGGDKLPDDSEYHNVRAGMYFGLLDWGKNGGVAPKSRPLAQELMNVLYEFTPKGKIIVEDKKVLRKRLRRSPDEADALALAVYKSRGASDYDSFTEDAAW